MTKHFLAVLAAMPLALSTSINTSYAADLKIEATLAVPKTVNRALCGVTHAMKVVADDMLAAEHFLTTPHSLHLQETVTIEAGSLPAAEGKTTATGATGKSTTPTKAGDLGAPVRKAGASYTVQHAHFHKDFKLNKPKDKREQALAYVSELLPNADHKSASTYDAQAAFLFSEADIKGNPTAYSLIEKGPKAAKDHATAVAYLRIVPGQSGVYQDKRFDKDGKPVPGHYIKVDDTGWYFAMRQQGPTGTTYVPFSKDAWVHGVATSHAFGFSGYLAMLQAKAWFADSEAGQRLTVYKLLTSMSAEDIAYGFSAQEFADMAAKFTAARKLRIDLEKQPQAEASTAPESPSTDTGRLSVPSTPVETGKATPSGTSPQAGALFKAANAAAKDAGDAAKDTAAKGADALALTLPPLSPQTGSSPSNGVALAQQLPATEVKASLMLTGATATAADQDPFAMVDEAAEAQKRAALEKAEREKAIQREKLEKELAEIRKELKDLHEVHMPKAKRSLVGVVKIETGRVQGLIDKAQERHKSVTLQLTGQATLYTHP